MMETSIRSHGDGRRMTLPEAIKRRARAIGVWGSLDNAHMAAGDDADDHAHDRQWAGTLCCSSSHNWSDDEMDECNAAEDVGLDEDGIPVAMCARCRDHGEG